MPKGAFGLVRLIWKYVRRCVIFSHLLPPLLAEIYLDRQCHTVSKGHPLLMVRLSAVFGDMIRMGVYTRWIPGSLWAMEWAGVRIVKPVCCLLSILSFGSQELMMRIFAVYFNDSLVQTTYAYDYYPENRILSNRRVFASFKGTEGEPDGLVVEYDFPSLSNYWFAVEGIYWQAHSAHKAIFG